MNSADNVTKESLTQKAVKALKWRFVGTALYASLQFIVGILLARLLSPEEFGIVGIALIVIGFGSMFGGMSFGVAIIQRSHLTQDHVNAAFTGSVMIGMLLFAGLWVFAPTISRVFAQESLLPVLRTIGLSFVFASMSEILVGLLRRELRFRTLAVIEITSYFIGFGIVGISLALFSYGIWSLVAAQVVQPLCLAILALLSTKQPLRPHFGLQSYRDLCRFTSAEMLNNLTNYTADNLSFFVVGKYLGASALGLFRRPLYFFIHLPLLHFAAGIANVMFPTYSRIQGDIPRLGRAHLCVVLFTALATMPVMFAMATVPEIVIIGLLGEQWRAAAGILRLLCLSGPFMAITRILGALSHARGYVFSEWWRQVIYLIIMGVALWTLLPFGLEGVALAVTITVIVRYLILAQLSVKLAGISWRHFFFAQFPGCLLGVIVSTSAYLASCFTSMLDTSYSLQLLIIVFVCIFSFASSLLLLPSSWFLNLYPWILENFSTKLPHWLRRLMIVKLSSL